MAEIQRQRIKSIYSEIKGYLNGLSDNDKVVSKQIGDNYNSLLQEISELAHTSFERHMVNKTGSYYLLPDVKLSMSSVVSRLESDYGFQERTVTSQSPIVVTVNANQQVSINVIPIANLIAEQTDEELKDLLKQLKSSVDQKDESDSKNILIAIADKSWELFLRALPYVLEKWG
jgi:hypothetical protein